MSSYPHVSVPRLRIGVFLIFLWWLPAYLLAPVVAAGTGHGKDADAIWHITIGIMIIQTAIGLLGVALAGRQVIDVLRHAPRKKAPKIVWHLFWSGTQE